MLLRLLLFVLLALPVSAQSLLGVDARIDGRSRPATVAATPTSCEVFIEKLVALAETPWWLTLGLRSVKAMSVGAAMVAEARAMLKPDAQGRPCRERPVDGFRAALVANGQRGEVYRHLLGHGGAMLLGPLGWLVSEREVNKDRRQHRAGDAEEGVEEAGTELVDDAAGRRVGLLMSLRIKGLLTRDQLRARLRKLLHE